jgi:hypothetical protein
MTDYCVHDNESSGSEIGENFLSVLKTIRFSIKSVPWS